MGDWFHRRPRYEPPPPRRGAVWEDARDVARLEAKDDGSLNPAYGQRSHVARICVEFGERTPPPPPNGYWTWESMADATEYASVLGVSASRRRERRDWLTNEEWTAEHVDKSARCIIADLDHPVEPGRYVVYAAMWASRDYWGEYDEGLDVIEARRSPGSCVRYWRRRAHERKAARRSRGIPA